MSNSFADQYRDFLKRNLPAAKDASGISEISCRCQYCPDSSDPRHGHMYISIPQVVDEISWFYCQKCHTTGLVNGRTLIEWGIYEPEIANELHGHYKAAERSGKTNGFNRTIYNIKNYIGNIDIAKRKLAYINDRLGTSISIQQAIENKIIFNIGELLQFNKIQKYTRHPKIVEQLNDYFVGFLSFDNNFVNLRRICDEKIVYESIDKRYINYNIHDKKDNTEKFYVTPYIIDTANSQRTKVHIAEGPFDILSIRYNLRNDEPGVYTAITGSAYKRLIKHLMNANKLYYIELHIYPDNDKSGGPKIINELLSFMPPYGIPVYIHRNTFPGEKDFGVPINRINETIVKLL